MDSKRKANGHANAETEERSAKRRKLAAFDLSKGETRESTKAYGEVFLEQIRRTQDKSGRLVATYFEKLLPREGNEEYYKRTRMPVSLETIEEKLSSGQFSNLAQLEGYFKRMIANVKEFYPRSSVVFDDAERVRKALSNYMTKNNPAYQTRGYQAVPTPLPPENGDEAENEEQDNVDEDAEGEDAGKADQDEEEEGGGKKVEEEEEPASRRRSIILKRTGSGRPARNSGSHVDSPRRSKASSRPDHDYANIPFKGLNFQQAQEKIVEELLRYKQPEYEGYFEPFVNLPPRSLRDYYRVISDPLSLKKLQKEIFGVQGRGDPTGISDFKTWNALEERAKLLWSNAYFYNEEGSEIYDLAQELEKAFHDLLKKARAAVQEPTQAKIKLKVGQPGDTPTSSKRVTIHVGGRTSSLDSPAPQAAQSNESSSASIPHVNGAIRQSALDAARSAFTSAPSPSPLTHAGLKAEEAPRMSPAILAPAPGPVPGTPMATTTLPPPPSGPIQIQATNSSLPGYVEPKRLRAPGKGIKDALMSRLRIQLHPAMQADNPILLDVHPLPREMQHSGTVNLPPSINRVMILPLLPDFLQDRQYSLWVLIDKQPLKPCHQPIPNQLPQERAFDIMLHPGVNVIEAHLIAAVPKHEREKVGAEVELEIFTAYLNVLRH
ncbi:hypothetical protein E4U21_003200 [Claviceps maximensis]|nr:hypothetical protein E4U21_003200 [Claviceps maximensis]